MQFNWKTDNFPLSALLPVLLLLTLAAFAPILSNNSPLLVWGSQGLEFPAFKKSSLHSSPRDFTTDSFTIHAPIPYSPTDINVDMTGLPPLSKAADKPWYYTHWLGTDELGKDVLAQLIHGCRTSVWVALAAMCLAFSIGICTGALGGYWHSKSLKISPFLISTLILLAVVLPVFWNAFFAQMNDLVAWFCVVFTLLVSFMVIKLCDFLHNRFSVWLFRPVIRFSPDSAVVGSINFVTAIPGYFALLTLLAIWSEPSISGISLALGLLMWPDVARLTRSSMISLRQTGLAEGAKSLGYSPLRIAFRHLLPNAIQPALVALGFGVGGAIVAESFLSFIGIAPAEMTSWGNLLAKTRAYPGMWWLSVFPGLSILGAVLVTYRISTQFQNDNTDK